MAKLQIPSNVKCITSGQVPTTKNLKDGEFAFGKVGGVAKLYGNVNGVIIDFTGGGGGGGGGTIDANTLLALLLGSNGIAIAKNATGDKVEAKLAIPETGPITLTNNNVPRSAIDITLTSGGPPASGGIVISFSGSPKQSARLGPSQLRLASGSSELTVSPNGIISWYNSSEVGHGLISGGPNGNVKTLFGNQSIYGSGNIDLYRHILWIKNDTSGHQIYITVHIISSSNTVIGSLTDLFSVLNSYRNVWYPCNGRVNITGYKGVAYNFQPVSDGAVAFFGTDGDEHFYTWAQHTSGLTVEDTVTTV